MKKTMKKVISIIITLVMVISTLTIAVPSAFAAQSTGSARAASSATGDGIVDGFDVSSIVAVSCYEYEYTDECFNEAGDVYADGYVDVIDLTFVISAANCEINIDQRGA